MKSLTLPKRFWNTDAVIGYTEAGLFEIFMNITDKEEVVFDEELPGKKNLVGGVDPF